MDDPVPDRSNSSETLAPIHHSDSAVKRIAFGSFLGFDATYWGVQWVADLHGTLSNLLLALIALHLAGVALASYRHRENLVAAMLHGRKRPGED